MRWILVPLALMLIAADTEVGLGAGCECHNVYDDVMDDDDDDDMIIKPVDEDGDGFYVEWGDCDDTDPDINPAEPEQCDDIDHDCDGEVDNLIDADGDGWNMCEDCNDADPFVYPGAEEYCNGYDEDCDKFVDEVTVYDIEMYTDMDQNLLCFTDEEATCLEPGEYESVELAGAGASAEVIQNIACEASEVQDLVILGGYLVLAPPHLYGGECAYSLIVTYLNWDNSVAVPICQL